MAPMTSPRQRSGQVAAPRKPAATARGPKSGQRAMMLPARADVDDAPVLAAPMQGPW